MTGAAIAAALVERGLDPAELPAKRSLFDLVLDAVARERLSPRFAWWVPGRLEVLGKHTDYAGGRTLVCAVPRGLAIAASPRRDGCIHVLDARRDESVKLEPAALNPRIPQQYTGWRHYVEVVARRLARNFPGAALGADVVFASDLPRAAGMSSSSALVVGVAAALARVAEIDARPEWQTNIRGRLDAAGYYACLENGMTFGTLEGDAGVGTHGGSEDHAAILAGAPGRLSAFGFVPMRQIGVAALPDHWRFVLAPCGVPSEKTGSAQESYNRLADSAQLLLALWNRSEPPAASLGAAIASSASAAGRLRQLVRGATIAGWPAAALQKRLDHFIREDARVPMALDAFQASDTGTLAHVSAESQADAETLLGNQIPATISLAAAAREQGAFAACSFGAGFGGSVWALVDREIADGFVRRWHPGAFVAVPGPALAEL
jgi:galactokinase